MSVRLDQVEQKTSNLIRNIKEKEQKKEDDQDRDQNSSQRPGSLSHIRQGVSNQNLGESQYSENFELKDTSGIQNFFEQAKNQTGEDEQEKKMRRTGDIKGVKKKSPDRKRWQKLSEKQREDEFLTKYDENDQLKKKITDLEYKFQTMNTNLHVIQKEYTYAKKKEGLGGTDKIDRELIKENEDLKTKNRRLQEKMMALASAKQVISQPKQQKVYKTIGNEDAAGMTMEKRKIQDLLQLIDMLNSKLKISDQTIRSLQKTGNQSTLGGGARDNHDKNIKLVGLQARYDEISGHFESQKQHLDQAKKKVMELNNALSQQKEETIRLKSQVRSMEIAMRHSEDQQKDLDELRRERNDLQKRLNDLAKSPFFNENNDRVSVQTQFETIKVEKVKTDQDNQNLKELNSRLETELELKKKAYDELNMNYLLKVEENASYKAQIEAQKQQMAPFKELQEMDMDTYLQALGTVKWKGEEPQWRNLDIVERERNQTDLKDEQDIGILHREIETLKLERSQLAAHLEKTQTLLNMRIEIQAQMENMHQAEINQLNLQLRTALSKADELTQIVDIRGYSAKDGGAIVERNGIQYDDTVSVFTVDTTDDTSGPGSNLFDLHIGRMTMMEDSLLPVSPYDKPSDLQNVLTFVTIDFYDHETQHSGISEGLMPDVNLQLSFKVLCDEFFITYLETGFIRLDMYIAKGAEPIKVGSANIALIDVKNKNQRQGISSVIKSIASFQSVTKSNQIIASVEFTMRMRKPITETLQWLQQKKLISIRDEDDEDARVEELVNVRKRNLMIIIERAEFLNNKQVNSFCYFSVQGNDYHGPAIPGQKPQFDFRSQVQILYDQKFISFLRHNTLPITLFDDSVEDNTRESDILGTANVKLEKLVSNSTIDTASDIVSMGKKVGVLYVKAFWFDGVQMDRPREQSLITRTWETDITVKIAQSLKSKGLTMQSSFMIFDRNGDQVISFDQFEQTVLDTLSMKMNRQEVQLYYKRLQQPVNYANFETTFSNYLLNPKLAELSSIEQGYMNSSLRNNGGVSGLKGMLDQNTQMLMRLTGDEITRIKATVNELLTRKLRRMNITELFAEIDQNNRQKLSLYDWKNYLLENGVGLKDADLIAFLHTIDTDNDNFIDINQFYGYIFDENDKKNRDLADEDFRSEGEIIESINMRILNFMMRNNLTFPKLHSLIDSDQNGNLSRSEFSQFFRTKLECDLTNREISIMMKHFDKNGNDLISVQQFVEGLKDSGRTQSFNFKTEYKKLYMDQKYELNQDLVKELAITMKQQKIKLSEMFNKIDKNNDGVIDRHQFMTIFNQDIFQSQKIDEQKMDNFFNHFDKDKSGKISISEFVQVMKPILEQDDTFDLRGSQSQHQIQNLRKRLKEGIANQHRDLIQMFKTYDMKTKKGFVSKKDFISILSLTNILDTEKTDVFDHFCIKDDLNNVDWVQFMDTFTDMDQAQTITNQIFSRISKVLQDMKMDKKQAFKAFDSDKDGNISAKELLVAFTQMQIPVGQQQVRMIMKVLDQSGDGVLNLNEFTNALQFEK